MTDYYKDSEPYKPPEPYGPRFTVGDVRQIQNENECGLVAAKQHLMRLQILEDLKKGKCGHDVALLYDILDYIVRERLTPDW